MGASSSNPICFSDFGSNSNESLYKCPFLQVKKSNNFSDRWVLFLLEHDGFLRGRICQVFTSPFVVMTESITSVWIFGYFVLKSFLISKLKEVLLSRDRRLLILGQKITNF